MTFNHAHFQYFFLQSGLKSDKKVEFRKAALFAKMAKTNEFVKVKRTERADGVKKIFQKKLVLAFWFKVIVQLFVYPHYLLHYLFPFLQSIVAQHTQLSFIIGIQVLDLNFESLQRLTVLVFKIMAFDCCSENDR